MKKIIVLLIALFMVQSIEANNINVNNISIGSQNVLNHTSKIKFDVSWENSWRTSSNENNYDGAWIFIKFRKKNAFLWQHATLNYSAPGNAAACGHTEASGAEIRTPSDGKGVWLYRNANGVGDVNFTQSELLWNYGIDGVADNDSVEVKVFAIEMVYIPQGPFYAGSGGTEVNHFRDGAVDTYYLINTDSSIATGAQAGKLFAAASIVVNSTIPVGYPTGFNAYWCMKYEISRQQYADFLNTIDNASAATRNPSTVTYPGTHPSITPVNPNVVATGLSFEDLQAIFDFSALRPMSELEYEKACRGINQLPVPNEMSWGNTTYIGASGGINIGSDNETWTNGNFAWNSNGMAPVRCGAFATDTSNRQQSGATYYGIMEMSGNAWEYTIGLDNVVGFNFTPTHGDGNLNAAAEANTPTWPPFTAIAGNFPRGGYTGLFQQAGYHVFGRISNRNLPFTNTTGRTYGGRGVRSAQ